MKTYATYEIEKKFPDSKTGVLIRGRSPVEENHKIPILAVHGMWGTSRRMENYMKFFAERGYPFLGINLRGHGNSRFVKYPGRISVFDYIKDVKDAIDYVGWKFNCFDPVLFGHSMGGLIVQKTAEETPVRALILLNSAPPAGIRTVRSWSLALSQLKYLFRFILVNRPFKPNFRDASRFIFNGMPRNQWQECYNAMINESGRAAKDIILGRVAVDETKIFCPALIVGCENDKIVHPNIARDLYQKYSRNGKATLKIFDKFAHWVQVEPDWQDPANEILSWLKENIH